MHECTLMRNSVGMFGKERSMKDMFFTIAGTKNYYGCDYLEPGMKVKLFKEPDNEYDKEAIRVELQQKLDEEKAILVKLEQGVKVLEKHKEKHRELYIAEEKALELKTFSELGITRFFRQNQDKIEEEEKEILKQLEEIDGGNQWTQQ